MVKPTHVEGRDCGQIFVYALSTCGWCKRTKALLKELGVAFDYVDVDLLEGAERDAVIEEMVKHNPRKSFPTIVIDGSRCIVGFRENEIREVAQR